MHGDPMKPSKKERLARIINYIKLTIALALMACMTYVFTFYLDGDIGVVIIAFLVTALVISYIVLMSCGPLRMEVQAPTYVAKGKRFTVKLRLRTEGKLPIPFLRLHMQQAANFTQDDPRTIQTSVLPKHPLELELGMRADYAGTAGIAFDTVQFHDYLGLFNRPAVKTEILTRVGIIPEIPSLTGAGVLLHTVSDVVLTQDDEAEESSAVYSAAAMPGYVHRDYVEGDSLRRINWKLSAKRNKLMVRMDEAVTTVRPSLILDLQPEHTPERLKQREVLMEGALGLLMLLVRQGIACTLRFSHEGGWRCLVLENEDAVRTAAVELAAADLQCGECRLDREAALEKAGAYLVYTAQPDAVLAEELTALKEHGYACCVVPEGLDTTSLPPLDALWLLAADFTMTATQQ